MTKEELVSAVATNTGATKVLAKNVIEQTFEAIKKEIQNEGKLQLKGFGTFSFGVREARTGINPATKEKIQIPEKKVCKFKPSSDFFSE